MAIISEKQSQMSYLGLLLVVYCMFLTGTKAMLLHFEFLIKLVQSETGMRKGYDRFHSGTKINCRTFLFSAFFIAECYIVRQYLVI